MNQPPRNRQDRSGEPALWVTNLPTTLFLLLEDAPPRG
jgi:hypothetical protein